MELDLNLRKNYGIWIYILLFLLFVPAIKALFVSGFYGASDELHVAWLMEMDKVLKLGQFPPRYVPTLSYNFGYPLFNFIFPLPFYLGELIHLLGFNFVDSIKSVLGLSLVLSGFSMYLFLKQFKSTLLAFSGSLLYVYTPYRSTDVYVRGAVGESLAFVFFPLVLLGCYKLISVKKYSWRYMSIYSLSLAALILTHNITALLFTGFLIVLSIVHLVVEKNKNLRITKRIIFGIVIALLVSSYFWVPAIYESKYFVYDTLFDVRDHFPTIKQLTSPYFGYGASVPGPYDGMSFFIGLPNLSILILGFIYFLYKRSKVTYANVMYFWSLVIFAVSVFMMNHRSTFLWMSIPYIDYFQFPWRFLTFTTLASPLFLIIFSESKKFKYLIFLVSASSLLYFPWFRPQDFLGRTDEHFLNTYLPNNSISEEYKNNTEEYLRMPKTQTEKPDKLYPFLYSSDDVQIQIERQSPLDAVAMVDTKNDVLINASKYNFPGWYVKVDGKNVKTKWGEPFGQVSFTLQKGEHKVEVGFKETFHRQILNLASLAALMGVVYLGVRELQTKHLS